LFADDLVRLPF